MAKKIGIEVTVDSAGAVTSLRQLGSEGSKTGKELEGSFNKGTASASAFNLKTIGTVTALTTVSYTALKLGKSMFNLSFETAKAAQKIETQFKTILGSAELARERYAELAIFASKTPFQLKGVAESSKILETLTAGTLSTGAGLRMVGDAAAIAGVNMSELSVTIGRAYSGLMANRPIGESASRLQELGLVSGDVRGQIEKLQAQSKGKEAWEVLRNELDKTKGGMEDLSNTLEGKISTVIDNLGLWGAKFLEVSGAQSAFNSALDASIKILDEMIESQNIDAILKKELTELSKSESEALLKYNKERLKQIADAERYNQLRREEAMAIGMGGASIENIRELRKKERSELIKNISSIEELIKKLSKEDEALKARKKSEAEYAEAQKNSNEAKEKAVEIAEKRRKAEEDLVKAIKAEQSAQKEAVMLEQQQQASDAKIASEEFYQATKIALLEESAMLDIEYSNRALARIEAEKQAQLNALNEVELGTREYAELSEQIIANSAKKKSAIELQQIRATRTATIDALSDITGALRSAFGDYKAFAIADIVVKGAQGIMQALTLPPPQDAKKAVAVFATTGIQLATVNRQKFANGGFVDGGGTGTSDSVNASLSRGEFVVKAKAVKDNRETLEAINNGKPVGGFNITVNAGMGTDGIQVAQIIVNELYRAQRLGLEPSVV